MLLLISDASVLIDIEEGELTNVMFSLPFEIAVPDILYSEELAQHHCNLLKLGLITKIMSSELIAEAHGLRQRYTKLSTYDSFALILAKHENSLLLTGDKALCKVAKIYNVETHGTIWLVEQMLQHKRITHAKATAAFTKMKNSGSRLPWNKVAEMLERYSSYEDIIT